jgi:biopolymer transport protein TolR
MDRVPPQNQKTSMGFLRKGFLRSANRRNELYCRIDPIPFLGLSFVLLCAFMTSEPMITSSHMSDLFTAPHAHSVPAARRWDSIRIGISRDGSIYFGNSKVAIDELPNRIRDATLNGAEKKVYLVVDARARYGDVKAALAQIQLTGIENVCFLTD